MMVVSAFHLCRLLGWRERALSMSTSTPSWRTARNEASSKFTLKTTWVPAVHLIDPWSASAAIILYPCTAYACRSAALKLSTGQHLARFETLVERYEPALVSEHLAWSTHQSTFFNDLLPLPYTESTLDHVCTHIDEVQEAIGQRILLENPSTYVAFAEFDDE